MTRPRLLRAFGACCMLLVGCGGDPKTASHPVGPTHDKVSTALDRTSVGITVYSDDFGLVRETRRLKTGKGRVALEYRDVTEAIQPETVHIGAVGESAPLRILEQNYRYDLLEPAKLLSKYEGKDVNVIRWNKELGKDEVFKATVLSANDANPIFKINGEITYGFPGRISFPDVPANLIAKPTLVWLLDSEEATPDVEVTYLTGKIGWSTDYVLVVGADGKSADLTGWVTLKNHSGASYENAKLKLVAGDVQRIRDRSPKMYDQLARAEVAYDNDEKQFKEEGFFEYHLYTLDRPTSVLDNEDKQVVLLEGHDIRLDKKLIFFGDANWYRSNYGQTQANQKVGVYFDIENKEANHLGIPLPKGVVRVYQGDASGAKQFVGEDSIDHTPRDERVRIKLGEAFDVVGDRVEKNWKTLGTCSSESDWEITLKNHKDTAVTVEDVEPVGGDWTILKSSLPFEKKDAHTFTFTVPIGARQEVKVTYRVRVSWC
ncbi:MAG TPA: hypothetical protein VF407_12075 [Polyangiaceae bacterium]